MNIRFNYWLGLFALLFCLQSTEAQQLSISSPQSVMVTNIVRSEKWVWQVNRATVMLHLAETNRPAHYRIEASTDLINWQHYCTFANKLIAEPGIIPIPPDTRQVQVTTLVTPLLNESWVNGVRQLSFVMEPRRFFRVVTSAQ